MRLSGDAAVTTVASLCDPPLAWSDGDAASPRVCDVALRVWDAAAAVPARLYLFPHGKSYTGETLLEIHTLGAPPILAAIQTRLLELGASRGVRLAERGEFTLRSLMAGRLDWTQAEGVIAVIEADDPESLAAALTQLAGGVRLLLAPLDTLLRTLLADLEVGLDFADDEVVFRTPDEIGRTLDAARNELDAIQRRLAVRSESRSRTRPTVVLVGKTNAGKSTLWNSLVALDDRGTQIPQAITSPEVGTTRDTLRADITLAGIPIALIDTAGADQQQRSEDHESDDTVHRAARVQSDAAIAAASLCLLCVASDDDGNSDHATRVASKPTLRLVTKSDLVSDRHSSEMLFVSAQTGDGIARLVDAIAAQLSGGRGELAPATAERLASALATAADAIQSAKSILLQLGDESLVASEVRRAAAALGELLGRGTTPDDTIREIFSRFCIGK